MKMKPTMYHGSDEDFEVFKLPYLEDGIYFSKDYSYAANLAIVKARLHRTKPIMYIVTLDIDNPYIVDGKDLSIFNRYTQRGYNRLDFCDKYDSVMMNYYDGLYESMVFSPKQIHIVQKSLIHF